MQLTVNKDFIEMLKTARGGQQLVSLQELKKIYNLLDSGKCRAIVMSRMCFVIFDEMLSIEFAVDDFKKVSDLSFIADKDITTIDASKKDGNYLRFILNEFIQGNRFLTKLRRFMSLLLPILVLNAIGYFYGGLDAIGDVFMGLLTAVSIFIAIFSLFVTSHDYLTRKKVSLFESGQLSYYFSVDKYVTQTGILAIIFSVFGLMLTSGKRTGGFYSWDLQNVLIIIALNLVFIGVYIILRSMVEFYIIRPGRFIMSDLKAQSNATYRNNKSE